MPLLMQTTFAFVVEKPGDALDGAQILIAAADRTEAERLAAARSKLWRAPMKCTGVIERPAQRGAA